jgi:uncharacterized protein (TIGR00297 family)
MSNEGFQWTIAVAGAVTIALAGYRARALTASGAVAAVVVGGVIAGAGGWWLATLLIVFFVTSSAWSRLLRRAPSTEPGQKRGDRRDAVQVAANGGIATMLALGVANTGSSAWLAPAAGAIAAAAADTWATDLGRRFGGVPRLIVTGRRVPRGTSGGVTPAGFIASAAGGATIGLAAVLVRSLLDDDLPLAAPWLLLGMTIAGLAGSVADSLLGATVQARYRCDICGAATEATHHCGAPTTLVAGWRLLDNDGVNALATLTGALAAALLQRLVA